jgi:hypothetical protein
VEHASKVALVALHLYLAEWSYSLRDGKWMTPLPREQYLSLLEWHLHEPARVGRWSVDPDLDLADWSGLRKSAPPAGRAAAPLKVA